MTDTVKLTRDDYRSLAKDRARSEGRKLTFIGQKGAIEEHKLYVAGTTYELAYPNDPDNKISPVIPATVETAAEYQESLFAPTEPAPAVTIVKDVLESAPEVPPDEIGNIIAEPVNPPLPVNEKSVEAVKAVNIPLPVTVDNNGAVNTPIPVMKSKKSHKGMLPNGRTVKGVPDFKNWFGRVYPVNITYPSWKRLSKTATDIANICIAKHDHAAHCKKKDSTGVPVIEFPFSEAVSFFKISRPTFDKSIKQLIEIGFIEYSSHGGIVNGHGVKARYRLSERWKLWVPTGAEARNKDDRKKLNTLVSAKQKPSKPVLHEAVNIPLPVGA